MDIPSISAVVAAVGVLVGVIFAYLEVRTLVKQRQTDVETRQAQLFMDIYYRINSKEFWKQFYEFVFHYKWRDFEDWYKKYSPEMNIEAASSRSSLGAYFEGIGLLVKRKLIDISLVIDLMGSDRSIIQMYWEKYEPIAKEMRKRYSPAWGEWTEYLYNEIRKREQQLQQTQQ